MISILKIALYALVSYLVKCVFKKVTYLKLCKQTAMQDSTTTTTPILMALCLGLPG